MEPLSVRNCLVLLLLVLSLLNLPHFTNASCSRPLQNDAILELYPDKSIYEELETVVLHCDPEKNYVGYGPGVIYCSNTSWVPDPIDRHCYEPCNAPPVESSVVHYDSSTLEEETVYRHDTIIQFACSEPETMSLFHPLGQESAICADGLWDLDELPVCLAKCLAPDGALQTGYYEHGATVKFSCEAGFRPNGDSTLECFDGQWSDTLTCEAIPSGTQVSVALTESDQTEQTTPAITTEAPVACQYPASSLDPDAIVDPVKDGYALFDIIDVRCNDAERMTSDGPDRFVCYSAELWVPYPEDFFCYSPCAAPSVDDSVSVTTLEGDFTEGIYLHGAIIEFSCTVLSRLLSGVTITSCADGVWVPDQVPTCVGKNSSDFSNPLQVCPFQIK
ncbi:complement factor H-like [Diadema antillarum]|uniref:complement factor H-like n=1 Tax=Diadema antillarum TaxID=105358 RepID=UPI003A850262